MTLDQRTLQAVADALVADMDAEDYCIGASKVRKLLRSLGATVLACATCGDRVPPGIEFCEWCDPNRPIRSVPVNAGQRIASIWEEVVAEKLR